MVLEKEGKMKKKNGSHDSLIIALGLVIIVLSFALFMFNYLNESTMYIICGITLAALIVFLYIRNYKDSGYGGRFKKHYPD